MLSMKARKALSELEELEARLETAEPESVELADPDFMCLVEDLVSMNDENLSDRVLTNNDVQQSLDDLAAHLEFEDTFQKLCGITLDTFGAGPQIIMMFEEMSELQKELCKNGRGVDNVCDIANEIADVQIVLEQMIQLFNCRETVHEIKLAKLKRHTERMRKHIFKTDEGKGA